MTLPSPRPGLVIRYAFLWSHEQAQGREEAAKDRPCAIVLASRRHADGTLRAVVAPITHRPPDDPSASLSIPSKVAADLGLDAGPHWIRIDELNVFGWPGYDLRPIPGSRGRYDYGMLPKDLFERMKAAILERQQRLAGNVLDRD
jgi:hypothetical protein